MAKYERVTTQVAALLPASTVYGSLSVDVADAGPPGSWSGAY
jgi:hypothetical protein